MVKRKKCIVIYTEGETEKEFYDALLDELKLIFSIDCFIVDHVIKKCLKGISKFDKKLINKFKVEISQKFKDCDIVVFLCYDTDVFEYNQNPPVEWNYVEEKLISLGACKVIHIKAESCIEDIFLQDIDGICKYLGIKPVKSISGKNGVDKLIALFKKGDRIYQKGYACDGFIKSLNLKKIFKQSHDLLSPFVKELIDSNYGE